MKTTQLLGFLTVIAIIGVHADLHIGCRRLCGFPFLSSSKCSVCCYRMGYSIGQCVTGQCLCSFPKNFKYEPPVHYPVGTPILMETNSNEPIKVKIADQKDSGTKVIKSEYPHSSNEKSDGHKTDIFDVKADFQLPKESLESIWESTQDKKKPMTDLFVDKSSISEYNHLNERQDDSKNNNNVSYSASLESNKKDNENTLSDEVLLAAATSSKLKEIPLELIDDSPPNKINDPIDFNPSAASALLAGRAILEGRDIITGLDIRASRRMVDESTNDLIPTREFLAPPTVVTAKQDPGSRFKLNGMVPSARISPDISRMEAVAIRTGTGDMRLGMVPVTQAAEIMALRTGTGDVRLGTAPVTQAAEIMALRTGTGDVRLGTAPMTQAAEIMALRMGTGDVRLGTAPVTQAAEVLASTGGTEHVMLGTALMPQSGWRYIEDEVKDNIVAAMHNLEPIAVRTGTGDVRLGTAPETRAAMFGMVDEIKNMKAKMPEFKPMLVRTGTGDVMLDTAPVTQAGIFLEMDLFPNGYNL